MYTALLNNGSLVNPGFAVYNAEDANELLYQLTKYWFTVKEISITNLYFI
jgi:hypothetical protein